MGEAGQQKLPLTAVVLAGGRSSRMGIDKTLLPIDGEALVARVAESVGRVAAHTLVVTNRPDLLEQAHLPDSVTVLTDEVAYQGPLGGLATALAAAEDEWLLVVAADMPWIGEAVVRLLWDLRDGGDVVIPVGETGPEPLLALYKRTALAAARKALKTGRRRIVAMFPELHVVEVPLDRLQTVDPDLASLVNVNTPEDLVEVRETEPAEKPDRPVIQVAVGRGARMPEERAVTIYMNDVEVATVQASPVHLEEMAAGFLVAEGVMKDRSAFVSVAADYKRGLVHVSTKENVPDEMVYKRRYITSGCGKGVTFSSVGHARGLDKVTSEVTVTSEDIYAMMTEMARGSELYRDSGGVHACALGIDGKVALVREDVGRHNAVDKLLGRAWLDGLPLDSAVLLSTGRISYEMTVKAAKMKVPVVVSRTSVTDLSAEIAGDLGITLVGYCRGGKMNVYTHPDRVLISKEAAE